MSIKIRLLLVFAVMLNSACVASKDTKPDSRTVASEGIKPGDEVVFQDWRKRCRNVNKKGNVCLIYQNLTVKDSGESMLYATFSFAGKDDKLVASFRVPFGILLTPGIAVKVDQNEQINYAIQTCLSDGCYAYVNIKDELLTQFKNGVQAKVGFMTMHKKQMAVNLSLKGFDAAINSLRGEYN